ncbi:MAG: aminopeptidase [Thermomicrobiales bacterium]|nr:aminopeptidase [Thermomicrobiales bacterium]
MRNPLIEKWAQVLVGYSVDVKPGQHVVVIGEVAAEELLVACAKEIIDRGAHPIMWPQVEGVTPYLLEHGSDEQLEWISPFSTYSYSEADVMIQIGAQTNTRRMTNVDPAREQIYVASGTELMSTFMRRSASGELDWTVTLYPTDAYAQDADMDTADFTDFCMQAMKLDQDDPVAAWQQVHDENQLLIDWLNGKSEIRLTGPDTDFTVSVDGRTWINSDGRKNFPCGEVFTGPVETSANGYVHFSFPVVTGGRRIEDIRLRFEDGKVVDATAAKNEEYLITMLDTDKGARYLGEFAFGTNYGIQQFIGNILFDEKIGGTVHMAVGDGYPETGSTNESAIHWDLICDLRQGGEVTVDGELFQKDGKFVI